MKRNENLDLSKKIETQKANLKRRQRMKKLRQQNLDVKYLSGIKAAAAAAAEALNCIRLYFLFLQFRFVCHGIAVHFARHAHSQLFFARLLFLSLAAEELISAMTPVQQCQWQFGFGVVRALTHFGMMLINWVVIV